MLDIDPFLGDQIRVGGLGGLGGMPPPEPPALPKPMPFFDLVGQAEGTDKGRGYNETLGYGKFTGGDVDITNMTVADVLRLQQGMLNHPQNNFNSSAVGRYQVVGQTLRDAVQNGVLKPNDKFDQEAQQKVATFLAQRRGADVTGLRNEWAGLKNVPDEQIMAAYNQQFGQPAAAQAPTDMRSRSFTGYAQQKQAEQSNPANLVALTNQGAVRNLPITETLQSGIASAVQEVYGPGFQARVYSGGQPRPGEGRRVGSTRHDDGNAADVYIYDPEGKRVTGDALGPLAAYWIKNNRGGVGLEMRGGGIHLDTHTDRAPFWTYGALTPGQQRAVQEAMAARGQGGTTATAYAPQQPQARAETMPASFGRALGGVAVRSPMAERIAASAENPGASAMPERPVQVASADPRAVPVAGSRSSAAPSPTPVQGQPNMPMEDYTQGPDRGALAFALMNAGMQPVGGGEAIGGLGGLGGFRPSQPSAAPAVAPSGPPQGQQSASPQPQSIDEFLQRAIPEQRPYALGMFGQARIANQKAAQERQTAIGMAKAMIAQGVDPNIAASLVGTPEGRAQLVRMQERSDTRAFQEKQLALQAEDKRADNDRADKALKWSTMSEPAKILHGMGVKPDDPEYRPLYKQLSGLTPDGLKQVKTSLQPIYGERDGKPVLMQTTDSGKAVETQLPPGVTVAKDGMKIETATETVILDPVTRQVVTRIPKNVAEGERQKEIGTAEGKSDAGASSVVQTAANALKTIEQIRSHPGKDSFGALGLGASLPIIGSGLPNTRARGFVNLVEQAKGQSFLQAFESLKGGGQITQVEGEKATQAIARLDRAQTKEDFEAALADLESVIKIGMERAQKRITVPWNDRPLPTGPGASATPAPTVPGSTPAPAPSAPAAQFRYNPATGKMEPAR